MSIKLQHSGGNSVSLNPPTSAPTSSEVAFKLPNADGTAGQVLQTDGSGNLSWVTLPSAGLSMHDSWYISSGWSLQTGGTQQLTSNWTRDTRTESGSIGSAMTQSSGVFTFPSTGIYKISVRGGVYGQGSSSKYYSWTIQQTSDNSNYSTLEAGYNDFTGQGANTYSMFTVDGTFDVTDVSLCKVRFAYSTESAVLTSQDIGGRHLHVTFTRLGDT
jgi:hypothetical protein